jgi:uncharacterized YigZ family protein
MSHDLVPAARYTTESWVKNSRFISTIGPSFSVEEAKSFISDRRGQYSDATHNVPAYIIGSGTSVTTHSSDNGEPSGTAGRPALSVLMGSGLGDVVLVITRYYGGTKLGTGGLVKAYGNAAKDAVQGVQKARKIAVHQCSLILPYNIYETSLRQIKRNKGFKLKERFTEQVQIDFLLSTDRFSALQSAITELSNGQIEITIQKKDQIALQPVNETKDTSIHA